jgi:hypothetical protein
LFDTAHNLKVTGSNPVPATNFLRATKRLHAALRGGLRVSKTRGSTVEASGREVLRGDAKPKTTLSAESGHLLNGTKTGDASRPDPDRAVLNRNMAPNNSEISTATARPRPMPLA